MNTRETPASIHSIFSFLAIWRIQIPGSAFCLSFRQTEICLFPDIPVQFNIILNKQNCSIRSQRTTVDTKVIVGCLAPPALTSIVVKGLLAAVHPAYFLAAFLLRQTVPERHTPDAVLQRGCDKNITGIRSSPQKQIRSASLLPPVSPCRNKPCPILLPASFLSPGPAAKGTTDCDY